MKKALILAVIALLAFGFGPAKHAFAQSKVVRLTLIDENGSGEDGSAQLTDQGDGTTKVELIMLMGAVLLVGADLLAKNLFSPLELPVGLWTTLIGGPLLVILMRRRLSGARAMR